MRIEAKKGMTFGRKFLLWLLLAAGVLAALIYGVAGIAPWADAQYVCPFGNQCSDARAVVAQSVLVVLTGIGAIGFSLRAIVRGGRTSETKLPRERY